MEKGYNKPKITNTIIKKMIPTRENPIFQRTKSFGSRIRIVSLFSHNPEKWLNKTIKISGWIRTVRVQGGGNFAFVEINDGSCVMHLQAVISKEINNFDELKLQGIGSCIMIKGSIIKSQGLKQLVNNNDIHEILVLGKCDVSNYKLIKSKDKIKLENLREIVHLRPRTNIIGCITRIRSSLAMCTHRFFQDLGFLYINTPIITDTDCENIDELFQVTTLLDPIIKIDYSKDFFKKPVFLTSSGQLELESYACGLSDVYSFGPTFRAEKESTSRHLSEFWMVEPEICFADLNDIMDLSEKYLKYTLLHVLENNLTDLNYIQNNYEKKVIDNVRQIVDCDFKKISYTEAIKILLENSRFKKNLFKEKVAWGIDLSSEHEKYLTDVIFNGPIFIFNYPCRVKSFYMRINDKIMNTDNGFVLDYMSNESQGDVMDESETVSRMDLLMPGIGEILGGSQREERYDELNNAINKEFGDKSGKYQWYLDLRKYGTVPHSGFGLGFDRLVMLATGMNSIKDVIPYPRYHNHADF